MQLNDDQIQRLADRILQKLQTQSFITTKVPVGQIVEAIVAVLEKHRSDARALDAETSKVMDQYAAQMSSGEIDPQRMRSMIRKQVADKLKFVLDPEEQVTHISHLVHDRIYNDDLVDYNEEEKALRAIKSTLDLTLRAEDILDDKVRDKIRSLKRGVQEGSPEWDILYRKYMDEELNKLG